MCVTTVRCQRLFELFWDPYTLKVHMPDHFANACFVLVLIFFHAFLKFGNFVCWNKTNKSTGIDLIMQRLHCSELFELRIEEYRQEMTEMSPSLRENVKEFGRKVLNVIIESGLCFLSSLMRKNTGISFVNHWKTRPMGFFFMFQSYLNTGLFAWFYMRLFSSFLLPIYV